MPVVVPVTVKLLVVTPTTVSLKVTMKVTGTPLVGEANSGAIEAVGAALSANRDINDRKDEDAGANTASENGTDANCSNGDNALQARQGNDKECYDEMAKHDE